MSANSAISPSFCKRLDCDTTWGIHIARVIGTTKMKTRTNKIVLLGIAAVCAIFVGMSGVSFSQTATDAPVLKIEAGKPGPKVSPMLYGLMTEEINFSYDGGL